MPDRVDLLSEFVCETHTESLSFFMCLAHAQLNNDACHNWLKILYAPLCPYIPQVFRFVCFILPVAEVGLGLLSIKGNLCGIWALHTPGRSGLGLRDV